MELKMHYLKKHSITDFLYNYFQFKNIVDVKCSRILKAKLQAEMLRHYRHMNDQYSTSLKTWIDNNDLICADITQSSVV